jgi:hypothetical protein
MRLPSGAYGSSTKLAWSRLAEYLDIARSNNVGRLMKALDANTQDHDAHPNAVLLCAIALLELHTRHTGRSSAQEARALEQSFETNRQTGEMPSGIWRPGN